MKVFIYIIFLLILVACTDTPTDPRYIDTKTIPMYVIIDESELKEETRARLMVEHDRILNEYCESNNISREQVWVTLNINASLEIHK
jgi:hypothetical protein